MNAATNEIRITDPKTGGQKGQKLERYDLLPFDSLDELAKVYGIGAQKYEDDNWLKGYAWRLSAGALLRHVSRFMQGEDIDDGPGGTGCHHLACAAWHCLTLMTFFKRGLGTDDRRPAKKAKSAEQYTVKLTLDGVKFADVLKAYEAAFLDEVPDTEREPEPAAPPTAKAKAGDKVEIRSTSRFGGGRSGTIEEVNETPVGFEYFIREASGTCWYLREDEIDLAPPTDEGVDEPTFKVGDRVRVIKEGAYQKDRIGTIEENDGDTVAPWWVRFADDDEDPFNVADLELFDGVFKVGDRVKESSVFVGKCVEVGITDHVPLTGRVIQIPAGSSYSPSEWVRVRYDEFKPGGDIGLYPISDIEPA